MSTPSALASLASYIRIGVGLAAITLIARASSVMFDILGQSPDHALLIIFFQITVICGLSFITHYLSMGTKMPSFVVAIFFGLAARPLLAPLMHEREILAALVGFGATVILFGGGLETPFHNFRKLFWKINALSFPGLLLTAIGISYAVQLIGGLFGTPVSIAAAVLLGAALASTDPAAIIPILKQLRFTKRGTKDIVIAESAMTDVTGSLLTIVFLSMLTAGIVLPSIGAGYANLLSAETGWVLAKEIIFGTTFGICGFLLLHVLGKFKLHNPQEYGVDAAFFIFVPVLAFTAALAVGGSGYLAAFVAGLLFSITEHLHATETFFNNTIDGFLKPMIFVLLGALVDPTALIAYAGTGLVVALLFMFVIRPAIVALCLWPFMLLGKSRMTWRELAFIAFVRETGAIPAVLLVTIVSLGIPGLDGLVAIGMWVILLTLIIEPPLTPLVARWLGIATPISDADAIALGAEPYVVLGSRGHSFVPRLPHVVSWASERQIRRVIVLLCLEDHYSTEHEQEVMALAEKQFAAVNDQRKRAGKLPIDFQFISRTGFLQKNIEHLAKERGGLTAIFVGRKMLDYRLTDIKNMSLPLFFID